MEAFLNKLYNYEYFGIYLMISIIVLLGLFILVLFFGKKNQRKREVEATKKLQQINNDAFKEDSLAEPLEVENPNQEVLNDTIIVPSIETIDESQSNIEEIPEPVLPLNEEMSTQTESLFNDFEPATDFNLNQQDQVQPVSDFSTPTNEVTPVLDKIEEQPFAFADFDSSILNTPSNNDPLEPSVSSTVEPIIKEVPEFNLDEVVKSAEEVQEEKASEISKGPQIFSSVYVPPKEDDIEELELPKMEMPLPKVPSKKELEFELPTLKKSYVEEKKEEPLEMPALNDYNLDSISGETYTINK